MLDAPTLRALADLAGPERAFLTVYLDADDEPSVLDARFDRIRALVAEHPVEAEHFEENLALVQTLLGENAAPAGGALAVYAGWATDLAQAFPLPEPVGTLAWVGDAPYVRPAYELLEEHETFAAAVLDNTSARVFLVTAEDVDEEGRVRGDVKNRVKKGGWSQKRYARRREKQIEQYAAELAESLAELDRERPYARLVLLGSDEPVAAVRSALPQPLLDKLVGTRAISADATEAEALDEAAEVAAEGERQAERDLWEQIREQGMGPGLSAFGATNVMDALRQARVEAVLVDREREVAGTKCRDCEHVAHGTPDTCGVCGSRDVFRVDLVEAMTEQAARTGAEVDFTDPFDALTEVGGVAALLRYSLARTDPEQEERERAERVRREREQREAEAPAPDESPSEAPALEEPASEAPFPETSAPAAPVPDEAPAETDPPADLDVTPAAEPAAEPVAEPAAKLDDEPPAVRSAEPDAEPAVEPAAGPGQRTSKRRVPDRPPSAPPATAETTAAANRPFQKGLGWALIALGLLPVALGVRELPDGGGTELLLGGGLAAIGAMNLLPPQRKAVRLALGAVGLLLVLAAAVLATVG